MAKQTDVLLGDLFDTKEKRAAAISALQGLRRSSGWNLIVQILEFNIKSVEDQILESEEEIDKERLQILRDRRYYQKKLKDLPIEIVNELRESLKENVLLIDENDPYLVADELIDKK